MIEVENAVNLLLQYIEPQKNTSEVEILNAVSFILADDVYSPISVPGFPKSAMDGYAVISSDIKNAVKDTPVTLEVIDCEDKEKMKHGTAVRVMTGGFIPEPYDCVIKQEHTDYGEKQVNIYKSSEQWTNYCHIGEDIKQGRLIIKKYTKLTDFHIGILASLGISKIKILKPLKVGIIATGNEIINPGDYLEGNKIYNSCSYMIASFLRSSHVQVEFMKICHDEVEDTGKIIDETINSVDMLITIGGISVGEGDILPKALELLEAEQIFKYVKMKPGTPVSARYYKDKIILSLSGNPFAAFVDFHIFIWPLLEKFMCSKEFGTKKAEAVVKSGNMKKDTLRRFIRAYEKDGFVKIEEEKNHASVMSNLSECNCLIDQVQGTEINVGDKVKIIYFK